MNTQKLAAEAITFKLSDLCRNNHCGECRDVAGCNHICHDEARVTGVGFAGEGYTLVNLGSEVIITLPNKVITITGSCLGSDEKHNSEAVTLTVSEVTL